MIKKLFNKFLEEEKIFFNNYPFKCLLKYLGVVCIMMAIIFAVLVLIPSAGLLMVMGFILVFFAHPGEFSDIAISVTGFKATRLLEQADVKLNDIKKYAYY